MHENTWLLKSCILKDIRIFLRKFGLYESKKRKRGNTLNIYKKPKNICTIFEISYMAL